MDTIEGEFAVGQRVVVKAHGPAPDYFDNGGSMEEWNREQAGLYGHVVMVIERDPLAYPLPDPAWGKLYKIEITGRANDLPTLGYSEGNYWGIELTVVD